MRNFGATLVILGLGCGLGSLSLAHPLMPSFSKTLKQDSRAMHMLLTPDIHGDEVVFASEGDLWLGSIKDRKAHRLTSDVNEEGHPRFSPDGQWIAFNAQYDGGQDVYLMPVEGGTPKRLTYDPYGTTVVGWTPDGQQVVFRSRRENPEFRDRLYTVSIKGSLPKALPMQKAAQASYSPDGSRLAFVRLALENHHWKRYHGGQANAVWILDLIHGGYSRIDDEVVNEQYPAWAKDGLYYISEKEGSANLWKYDPKSHDRRRLTNHEGLDVRSLATDGTKLIYAWGYQLFVYDIKTQKEQAIDFDMPSDHIHARPVKIGATVSDFALGPTGKRVLISSRGQLFSVGATKGEAEAVAPLLGTESKEPVWSPDGTKIAFISDRSGEENVWVVDSTPGAIATQLTQLTGMRIDSLKWSPDSKSLAFEDLGQRLWLLNVAKKESTLVSENKESGFSGFNFSPDSAWITYSGSVNLVVKSIYLYNIASKATTRVTNGPTSDTEPVFDPGGKYLYFISQRSIEPEEDEIDFQMDLKDTFKIYLLTLAKDTPSPRMIKSEEEPGQKKGKAKKDDDDDDDSPSTPDSASSEGHTKIDLDGLSERIIELSDTGGNYHSLGATRDGVIFISSSSDSISLEEIDPDSSDSETLAPLAIGYSLSADLKKMIVRTPFGLQIGAAGKPLAAGAGVVDLSLVSVTVDPVKEWKEIFEQAWRNERDIFYDPNQHGMNWKAVHDRYAAWLPAVGSRSELNILIGEMIGEMNVSHSFVAGGFDRVRSTQRPQIGSLGLDLVLVGQNFRIKHLLRGDGYSLTDRSPLLEPGLGVKEGDVIFSIDGEPLQPNQDPNALLIGKGGKLVVLSIGETADPAKAKLVRVKAMDSDVQARYYDWVGQRRNEVATVGGSNLAYIHLPDMENAGIRELTKWLYANLDKDGLIIDVRYNHGGDVSGQVLERLSRVIFEYDQGRYGAPQPYHRFGYSGRIVVLCNEDTSSDGEYFCTGFKYMNLGPVIGTRTWGGYMAVAGPPVLDGGVVAFPIMGSFSPDNKWLPDGTGFTPEIIVPEDPAAFQAGRDNQLDKAIEVLKELIAKNPVYHPKRLPPPSKVKAFTPNKPLR